MYHRCLMGKHDLSQVLFRIASFCYVHFGKEAHTKQLSAKHYSNSSDQMPGSRRANHR